MNRRAFMAATSGAGLASLLPADSARAADDNDRLPKFQSHPLPELGSHWPTFEKLSARCRPALSYLSDAFDDPADWCDRARTALLNHLHYAPPTCDPNPESVETVDLGDYTRERVMINTTPDIRIPVYVLIPKGLKQPAPAMVALHDHGGFYFWGKEKVVHVTPEHPELAAFKRRHYGGRSIADELAKRGYVVIAPDMLHWGERALYLDKDPSRISRRTLNDITHDDILAFNARSWAHEELVSRTALTCGVTWSGIITRDDVRTADYLLTRPEVDPMRVGCVGLSLGSVRSIFLGALHPAVRASVAVCWMAEYQPMAKSHVRNGIGFTKLVPGLYADLDWPDLGGLHWPGALMTINGLQDQLYPLQAARNAVDKIRTIFDKMRVPEKYEGVFFDGPHEFNVAVQDRAFDWLDRQLVRGV